MATSANPPDGSEEHDDPAPSATTADSTSDESTTSQRATGRRGLRRPLLVVGALAVLVVGIVGIVGVAATTAHGRPARTATLTCADVASSTGLTFNGDYGPVFPVQDAMGDLMQRNMGNGAAVGDYNGDGYQDVLLLGQAGHHTKLFRNEPGPGNGRHFTDVTAAAGLGSVTSNARVAQFVDLSGSGRPDLVIAADYLPGGPAGPSQIFRNNGDATFTDVTAGSGFDPQGYIVGGMAFADYDGSGRQSIWLSYWTEELSGDPGRVTRIEGTWPGHNRLYQNLGNYHFKDVTDDNGIGEYHADSFTAVFADFTGDNLPDIYQANDHRVDRFYRNLGGGRFIDDTIKAGLDRAGNSMGVATTVGADGMLNLYITNITDPGGYFGTNQGNTFMMSSQDATGIHFSDDASGAGIVDTAWGWGTAFVDMDGDGAPDLYAVQGMREFVGNGSVHLFNAKSFLFRNDGTGRTFAPVSGTGCDVPGDQRALVVFDYNRDGAPDLLISQVNGPSILLENLLSGKHWLTVAPSGANDAGIDARVTVTAGGHSSTQLLLAGGSYLAGPPREAYFGLGSATMADHVQVRWANGKVTDLANVAADQVLTVPAP